MVEISNLRTGRTRRHAALIVSSALGAVLLAGVAARPNLDLRHAELELVLAEKRVEERQRSVQELVHFERSGGLERIRAGLQALSGLVPARVPELELHGLLRLIAERNGITLSALEIGAPTDPGLERLDDVALVRAVRLEGTSALTGLFAAIAALKKALPGAHVLEFHVGAAQEQGDQRWTLVLGIFEAHQLEELVTLEESTQGAQDPETESQQDPELQSGDPEDRP